MKILLIGGTGRLSLDTTRLCLEKGHQVYLINRGHRNIIKDNNIHYLIGDINDEQSAEKALGNEKFDVIVDYLVYKLETLRARISFLKNRMEQYVFISSATVYPKTDREVDESFQIGNDGWGYAKEKRLCEEYLREHGSSYPFHYTIIRPYVTYDNRRIPFPIISKQSSWNLIYRIQNDLPLLMPGDGNQLVTLTSTIDFARGIIALLGNTEAYEEDYNIVGDTVVSWNDVVHAIEKHIGKKAHIVYCDTSVLAKAVPDLAEELVYDKANSHIFCNEKIKSIAKDFTPCISIEQGMKRTVDYLLANKKEQIFDRSWNAMENVLCEKYGKAVVKASISDHYLYFKMNNKILRKIKRILK